MVIGTDPQENYPQNYDNNVSFVSCSATRAVNSITAWDMKTGVDYEVDTGYMLYDDAADFETGTISGSGKGTTTTMRFESAAAALMAGTFVAVSSLAF
jgi:hypothetical protein